MAAESLAEALGRMDQAATEFRGMTAKLRRTTYTAVIKDTAVETGAVAVKSSKPGEVQFRVDFTSPDEKTWAFRGRKAELFIPKINTVQEYDLGKHGRLVDQFLLLGFGASSKQLSRSYTISMGGDESIGGQKTSRLELIPKSGDAQQHLKRVEIWLPLNSGNPLQQKFHLTSGDYVLVSYTDLKLDRALPDSAVRLNLPKNVKREYPQR